METTFANDLTVVRRHFPLVNIHPNAFEAAQVSEAAARQGMFDAMADLLLTNQAEWAGLADPTATFEGYAQQLGLDLTQFRNDVVDPAITARVQRDADDAVTLMTPGTPAFYLNGTRIENPQNQSAFEALIQEAVNAYDSPFKINRQTGQLQVVTPSLFDFETTPVFVITVNVTDETDFTESVNVTVNVADLPEPSSVNGEGEAEAALFAAAVDALLACDADPFDTLP